MKQRIFLFINSLVALANIVIFGLLVELQSWVAVLPMSGAVYFGIVLMKQRIAQKNLFDF
jgi:uncharacterized membrane protein